MDDPLPDMFYSRQVNENSCGTQAMMSILLNREEIEIGPTLQNFKEFSTELDSSMKGYALISLENLRDAHNSFRDQSMLILDSGDDSTKKKEDPFHYVAFVPVKQRQALYLLDGLQGAPIKIADLPQDDNSSDWTSTALGCIRKIVQKLQELPAQEQDAAGDIRFNLMACVPTAESHLVTQITQLQSRVDALKGRFPDEPNDSTQTHAVPPDDDQIVDAEVARSVCSNLTERINTLEAKLSLARKLEKVSKIDLHDQTHISVQDWTQENLLRKHDMIPFVFECLRSVPSPELCVTMCAFISVYAFVCVCACRQLGKKKCLSSAYRESCV